MTRNRLHNLLEDALEGALIAYLRAVDRENIESSREYRESALTEAKNNFSKDIKKIVSRIEGYGYLKSSNIITVKLVDVIDKDYSIDIKVIDKRTNQTFHKLSILYKYVEVYEGHDKYKISVKNKNISVFNGW